MARDRRRYRRAGVSLEIAIEAGGRQWGGKTVDLSPYGAKAAFSESAEPSLQGMTVDVRLSRSDGGEPLSLLAQVVRTDPDGIALSFVNLRAVEFAALRELVDALPTKDRRQAPRVDAALAVNFEGNHPYSSCGSETVNLSPFGIKVALPGTVIPPAWGTRVRLRLAGAASQPSLPLKGLVWRSEPHGLVLLLAGDDPEQRERLKALIEALGGDPPRP